MTGNELIYWLEELWYDLLNPGQANLIWLIARLFLVYVAVWFFGRIFLDVYRSVTRGFDRFVYRPVHRLVTAPKRWHEKRRWERESEQREQEWQRYQLQQEESRKREEIEKRAHEQALFEKIMKAAPASRRKR